MTSSQTAFNPSPTAAAAGDGGGFTVPTTSSSVSSTPPTAEDGLTHLIRPPSQSGEKELHSLSELLFLTAWHAPFFASVVSPASESAAPKTPEASLRAVVRLLDVLDAAGYSVAGQWAATIDAQLLHVASGHASTASARAQHQLRALWRQTATELELAQKSWEGTQKVKPAASAAAALAFSAAHNDLHWQQGFHLSSALHVVSAPSTANKAQVGESSVSLHAILHHLAQRSAARDPPSSSSDGIATVLLQQLACAYATTAASADSSSVRNALSPDRPDEVPFLFTATAGHTAHGEATDSAAAASASAVELMRLWQEAALYAALSFANSYATIRPLAKLLVLYITQDDGLLAAQLSGAAVTLPPPLSADSAEAASRTQQTRRVTRIKGLIAGILAYSLHCARSHPSEIAAALTQLTASLATSSSPSVAAPTTDAAVVRASAPHNEEEHRTVIDSPRTAWPALSSLTIAPRATDTEAVLLSAVLLLVELVKQLGEYSDYVTSVTATSATNKKPLVVGTGSTAAPTEGRSQSATGQAVPLGECAAQEVFHVFHELLFTIVLGRGTEHMVGRPAGAPMTQLAMALTTVAASATAPSSRTVRAHFSGMDALLVTTHRGLVLAEVDAVTQSLFPALAQQIGYEWTWSELLRQCRLLDKQQQPPTEHGSDAKRVPVLYVTWSSRTLMENVLLAVARRTYPERLQSILPGSYDRLLESIGMLPPAPQATSRGVAGNADAFGSGGDDGEGDATRQRGRRGPLFELPAYYKEPGTVLCEYIERTGVAGLRVEEMERILHRATASLPLIVQLRAQGPRSRRANTADGGYTPLAEHEDDANEEEGEEEDDPSVRGTAPLSRARVEALETRYQLEVLVVSIVVCTQLRVPSYTQQLMRVLAPLLARLSLSLGRLRSALEVPLLHLHRSGERDSAPLSSSSSSSSSIVPASFTSEAALLMDSVHYQFYPLEWLPQFADAYSHAQKKRSASVGAAAAASSWWAESDEQSSVQLPYSPFAAVAHQLELQLRLPLSEGGEVASARVPSGARSDTVCPPSPHSAYLLLEPPRSAVASSADAWRRVTAFLQDFVEVCYLDSRLSSCELEGTLAVTATRRVQRGGGTAGGDGGSASVSALSSSAASSGVPGGAAEQLRRLLQTGVFDTTTAPVASSDDRAHQTATTTPSQAAGKKRGRDSVAPSSSSRSVSDKAETLRAVKDLLLRYGAASYDVTIEAEDVLLTVAQCFLPVTSHLFGAVRVGSGGGGGGTAAAAAGSATASFAISTQLVRGAVAWCQEMVGAPSDRARVSMLLQQHSHRSLAMCYNSCTFDCAIPARRVLREVPRRLLEKMRLRQAHEAALVAGRLPHRSDGARSARGSRHGTADDGADADGQATAAEVTLPAVDALLAHQWMQWQDLLQHFTLHTPSTLTTPLTAPLSSNGELTAAQWLWYSPYSTGEVQ